MQIYTLLRRIQCKVSVTQVTVKVLFVENFGKTDFLTCLTACIKENIRNDIQDVKATKEVLICINAAGMGGGSIFFVPTMLYIEK